ncbi:lamin tail domain-containing protein, partial [bacterium]|nr:lamin tail domain-containing protein [bacterium]
MKKIFTVLLSLFSIQILNAQTPDHLVITEVAAQPTNGEFIEIHNPTSSPINLSNYYLSDSKNYYNLPATTTTGSGEFIARFPNVEIAAGAYLTIAANTAEKYFANYGTNPDFKMVSDTTTLVTQMISPFSSAIATNSGLGNSNELVVLFFWDGTSELVKDVDYVFWGSSDTVDKSGVTIGSSTYANDTAVSNQVAISTTVHANGSTWQRYNPPKEFGETLTGGNGITGNNETSETLSASFGVGAPTLKSASTISPPGADGSGTVTVSPNSVPNSANTTLTFTFSGT